jgi:hypothetical protein
MFLIGAILAVGVPVALPVVVDAQAVQGLALEFVGGAGIRVHHGTVLFLVQTIVAVLVAIAHPGTVDALLLLGAQKLVHLAHVG